MNSKGLLIVLSGPSGVGKGTLLKYVIERNPNIFVSVSATTREPRAGEIDGVHYHFISKEQFKSMVDCGDMLEYAIYGGNFYGTPASKVEELLQKGNDVVLEIEVQGAMQIKDKLPEAVMIFVMPPSYEVLKNRLTLRNTETEEQVKMRLNAATKEISEAALYDYVIINDDLEEAVHSLENVLKAAKCTGRRFKDTIKRIVWAVD